MMDHIDSIKVEEDEDDFSVDSWDTASNEELEQVMEYSEPLLSPEGSDKPGRESKSGESLEEKLEQFSPNINLHVTEEAKQLLEETPETRELKREKNRLAARRCRQKQKDRISYLEKDVKEIEVANYQVETEIKMLQQQLHELRDMLLNHNCVMAAPRLSHRKFTMNDYACYL